MAEIDDIIAEIEKPVSHTRGKRGPGRPAKKKQVPAPIECRGVVATPASPDNCLEMIYTAPLILKKIFSLLRAYNSDEISLTFEPASAYFFARDHIQKSHIYIDMDCSLLNFYYCKERIKISMKRDLIEKILTQANKDTTQISFMLKDNFRTTLCVILYDNKYQQNKLFEIEVLPKQNDHNIARNSDENYPIKFMLDSKRFKEEIVGIRKLSKFMSIHKAGTKPLELAFEDVNKVSYNGIYGNADLIKLTSKIAPNDIFSVSIAIDYIKPFANSVIGEEVWIAADKTEWMSFTTHPGKKTGDQKQVFTIKVFTEIKGYVK